jgi:hypothetical protein
VKPRPSLPGSPVALESKIHLIRGQKVMLDSDLAELYQVSTKQLNQMVRRNLNRFPAEFAFVLENQEFEALRSQIATSNKGRGGRRYLPYVFTEHGVAMLSAVLHSDRAVQVSIFIVRTFVRLREMIAADKNLAARIEKLEDKQEKMESSHAQHASIIKVLAQEIGNLKKLPDPPSRHPIGFRIRGREE